MISFEGDYGISVVKLAGPGVPGLEDDTPLYHFDVPAERMAEFQQAKVRSDERTSAASAETRATERM